jgi:protein-L-isoaspartate(D-aspartate) O-methyltransferase
MIQRHWIYPAALWGVTIFLLGFLTSAVAVNYAKQRAQMVEEIEADIRFTSPQLGQKTLNERVRQALLEVPRHEFVPRWERPAAYMNRPLPIGHGQTISQPYIVAIMTDLLNVEPKDVVFELGTGSGYQAAILAELVSQVYTMEIIDELGKKARRTLKRLGYANVEVRVGDGYYGWEKHAPFDAIIVTAAGDHIPPPLVQQLKPGGRMLIPVGGSFLTQQLMLVQKEIDGTIRTRSILPVRFVPITGEH